MDNVGQIHRPCVFPLSQATAAMRGNTEREREWGSAWQAEAARPRHTHQPHTQSQHANCCCCCAKTQAPSKDTMVHATFAHTPPAPAACSHTQEGWSNAARARQSDHTIRAGTHALATHHRSGEGNQCRPRIACCCRGAAGANQGVQGMQLHRFLFGQTSTHEQRPQDTTTKATRATRRNRQRPAVKRLSLVISFPLPPSASN